MQEGLLRLIECKSDCISTAISASRAINSIFAVIVPTTGAHVMTIPLHPRDTLSPLLHVQCEYIHRRYVLEEHIIVHRPLL